MIIEFSILGIECFDYLYLGGSNLKVPTQKLTA